MQLTDEQYRQIESKLDEIRKKCIDGPAIDPQWVFDTCGEIYDTLNNYTKD